MAGIGLITPGGNGTSGSAADTLKTTASSTSALTLDFTLGTVQDVTLTAACTITLTGATAGTPASMTVLLRQDGTGSRTVVWPAAVKWPGGTPPTLSTGVNKVDVVSLLTNDGGTTVYGFAGGTDLR